MVLINPICCSGSCSFSNEERAIQAIQFALATVTIVGGLTATFALVGYLPSFAAWIGISVGGTSLIGFCIVTVKYYYTQEEYLFDLGAEELSNENSKHLEKESIDNDFNSALQSVKEPKLWLSKELSDPNPLFLTDEYLLFLSADKPILWNFAKDAEYPLEEAIYIPIKGQKGFLQIHEEEMRVIDLELKPIKSENFEKKECVFQRAFHDSNFVYVLWLSTDKKTQILKRWDTSLESSQEIRIPCSDESIEMIDVRSFDEKIVCAYKGCATEVWNLDTNEKISDSTYRKGQKLDHYLIVGDLEVYVHGRTPTVQKLNSNKFDVYFHSVEGSYRCVFMEAYKDRVLFALVDEGKKGKVALFIPSNEHWFEWDLRESVHEKSFCFHEGNLIIGSCDGRVSIQDLDTGKCLYDESIFDSKVSVNGASGSKVALSWNNYVAVLDFSERVPLN